MQRLLVLACILALGCEPAPTNGPAADSGPRVETGAKDSGSRGPRDAGSSGARDAGQDASRRDGGTARRDGGPPDASAPAPDSATPGDAGLTRDASAGRDAGVHHLDAAQPNDAAAVGAMDAALDATLAPDSALPATRISFQVGAAGGQFEAFGLVFDVPANAVSARTEITVELTDLVPPPGYTAFSPVYRLLPADLSLLAPIQVSLPFTGSAVVAAGFVSDTGEIYDRVGGGLRESTLQFPLRKAGLVFVGDGMSFPPDFDRTCVRTRVLEGRPTQTPGSLGSVPNSVGVLTAVEDCEGRPMPELDPDALVIAEDSYPLEGQPVAFPSSAIQPYVLLVLDISTTARVTRPKLVASAKEFVHRLLDIEQVPARVGVLAFDGSTYSTPVSRWPMPFFSDSSAVYAALDAVAALSGYDPSSADLYTALRQGLAQLAQARANVSKWNKNGAAGVGYAVIFSNGNGDTAGRYTLSSTLEVVRAAPERVLAISMNGPLRVLDALGQVAQDNLLVSHDEGALVGEFSYLATRLARHAASTYLLGYCSPKRSGSHQASVEVAGAENRGTSVFSFDATSFGGSCSPASLVDGCSGKQCGGFYCGACDVDTEYCDSVTLTCLPGAAEAVPTEGAETKNCGSLVATCSYPEICCGRPQGSGYSYSCTNLAYCGVSDRAIECDEQSDCAQPALCCTGSGRAYCRRGTCGYGETPTTPITDPP